MDFATIITLAAIALVVILVVGGGMVFLPQMLGGRRLRQRLENITGDAKAGRKAARGGKPVSKKRNIQARLKEAEDARSKAESRIVKYRQDLKKAGYTISLKKFFVICGIIAVVAFIAYLLSGYPRIGAIPAALTIGFGIPLWWVKRAGKKRAERFTFLFADAVDVIVRGIRSGLPVGECLNIIARESPDPVGPIFREIVEATKLGLSLEQGLERAEEQMPTAEMKFFSIVLSIQAQTGGNLADTLGNLTGILRDRKKMKDKVQALSQEAKSSAGIIGSLPFLVTGLLYLVSPDYIEILFTDSTGQVMVMGGLVWMSMGIFVMKQMINFEI